MGSVEWNLGREGGGGGGGYAQMTHDLASALGCPKGFADGDKVALTEDHNLDVVALFYAGQKSFLGFLQVKWVCYSGFGSHGTTDSRDVDGGRIFTFGILSKTGVGLKSGHGRAAVVQNYKIITR